MKKEKSNLEGMWKKRLDEAKREMQVFLQKKLLFTLLGTVDHFNSVGTEGNMKGF